MLGRLTSAVYFALPVALSSPSTRGRSLYALPLLSASLPTGVTTPAAESAASNTFGYVPQRQRFPEQACRTCSSVTGLPGLPRSSAETLITKPGVQ